ncbi:rhomboid family intramembrane serine protease [Neptuniibacter halophilus]|uniref:rhomboid family intramembrane serine protease n=1 Tax=Neptuniibacter halophilus TaxID=651666 RepID=UPI002573AAFF|nr:rhomboid family intramembrane serine protease [Neptuniibacter halophilus]
MIKLLTVPLDEDLTEFTRLLWRYEVPHRVVELETTQELWVARSVDAEQLILLYEHWRNGADLSRIELVVNRPVSARPGFLEMARRAWFSVVLIATAIMLSLLIGFGENLNLLRHLTLSDLILRNGNIYSSGLGATLESMQWWRLVTPVFLHFSMPHLLFNVLWVWVVGCRIEIEQGRGLLILLALFSGLSSNLAQYWVSGPRFGGLSGIVFALLGYAWCWDKFNRERQIGLPPALMGLMLFWLALGYTGVLTALGFGEIANTAHLVGLIAGVVFVPVARMVLKRRD